MHVRNLLRSFKPDMNAWMVKLGGSAASADCGFFFRPQNCLANRGPDHFSTMTGSHELMNTATMVATPTLHVEASDKEEPLHNMPKLQKESWILT